MANEKYNGWANYETWRINLEIIDDAANAGYVFKDSNSVEEYVEEVIEINSDLAMSYALAFISNCDWREIFNHAKENTVLSTPWAGNDGTLTDLFDDCDDSWEAEDVEFLLETNEEWDLLDADQVEQLENILDTINNQ